MPPDPAPALSPPPVVPPVKPGWRTTEFYVRLLAIALSAVFASGILTNNTAVQIASIAAFILTAEGYNVNRTIVKNAAVLVLLVGLVHTQAACGASARQKSIHAAFITTDAARVAFVAFDAQHQQAIIAAAKDEPAGKAALAAYRDQQFQVEQVFMATYRAIAAAATVNDDQSLSALLAAAAILAKELDALGIRP